MVGVHAVSVYSMWQCLVVSVDTWCVESLQRSYISAVGMIPFRGPLRLPFFKGSLPASLPPCPYRPWHRLSAEVWREWLQWAYRTLLTFKKTSVEWRVWQSTLQQCVWLCTVPYSEVWRTTGFLQRTPALLSQNFSRERYHFATIEALSSLAPKTSSGV